MLLPFNPKVTRLLISGCLLGFALLIFVQCDSLGSRPNPRILKKIIYEKEQIDKGLRVFRFPAGRQKGLVILDFNLVYYQPKLLTTSGLKLKDNLNAKQWVEKHHLTAATNAGMYQKDYLKSVGLLIANGHVNNRHYRDNQKSILAFGPKRKSLPPVQIIDRECEPKNLEDLMENYHSLLQSIRMVTCRRQNTWQKKGEKWPIAALGMSQDNHLLMIFNQAPQTPHDFINMILDLNEPKIKNMMYLEGGPPAQLYMRSQNQTIDLTGSQSTRGREGSLAIRVTIPNIIGMKRRR